MHATRPTHLILLELITILICAEDVIRVPVPKAWRVLQLRIEETVYGYEGYLRIY